MRAEEDRKKGERSYGNANTDKTETGPDRRRQGQGTAEGWYVAHPDLTVRDISHVKRIGKAAEEFLDKIG